MSCHMITSSFSVVSRVQKLVPCATPRHLLLSIIQLISSSYSHITAHQCSNYRQKMFWTETFRKNGSIIVPNRKIDGTQLQKLTKFWWNEVKTRKFPLFAEIRFSSFFEQKLQKSFENLKPDLAGVSNLISVCLLTVCMSACPSLKWFQHSQNHGRWN